MQKQSSKTALSPQKLHQEYARFLRFLRGLVPEIKTFALIPAKKSFDTISLSESKLNHQIENKNLESYLIKNPIHETVIGCTKVKITNPTGGIEEGFFIPNITRDRALRIAKEHQLEEIVFGEQLAFEVQNSMRISCIKIDSEATESNSTIGNTECYEYVLLASDPELAEENQRIYPNPNPTFYKRKDKIFYLPFFQNGVEFAEWNKHSMVIDLSDKINKALVEKLRDLSSRLNNGCVGFARYTVNGRIRQLVYEFYGAKNENIYSILDR